MKTILAIFCLAVVAHGFPRNEPCQLQRDLQDMISLIDTDAVAGVLWRHIDDPEMQEVFGFVFSQRFRDLYLTAADQPEIVRFGLWMEEQCVDLRPYLNAIRDFLEMPPVPWSQSVARHGGVAGFWAELLEVLNLPAMHEAAQEKYQTSPDFAAFVDNLRGPEAYALYQQLAANEVYQYAIAQLEAYGLNISAIREIIQSILGW